MELAKVFPVHTQHLPADGSGNVRLVIVEARRLGRSEIHLLLSLEPA